MPADRCARQRERVEEQADEPPSLRPLAMRNRHRDDDIVRTRQAMEPCVERGKQNGERRRMRAPREFAHIGRYAFGQPQRHARAAMIALGGAGALKRKRERFGRCHQCFAPVRELPLALFARYEFALPLGVVGVLDRQGGQQRFALFNERRVRGRQFTEDAARTPAVHYRVVSRKHQAMRIIGEGDEGCAQQRAFR